MNKKIVELNLQKFKEYYNEVNTDNITGVLAVEVDPNEYYGPFNYNIYAKKDNGDYYFWCENELTDEGVKDLRQ